MLKKVIWCFFLVSFEHQSMCFLWDRSLVYIYGCFCLFCGCQKKLHRNHWLAPSMLHYWRMSLGNPSGLIFVPTGFNSRSNLPQFIAMPAHQQNFRNIFSGNFSLQWKKKWSHFVEKLKVQFFEKLSHWWN